MSLHRTIFAFLLGVGLTFGMSFDAGAEQAVQLEGTGPHGGTTWSISGAEFELATNPGRKEIDLYFLAIPRASPQSVKLKSKKGGEVILKMADPWRGLPHYKAVLGSPSNPYLGTGSFKGLEVQFEFGK